VAKVGNLQRIAVDNVGIGNHRVHSIEEHWPPGLPANNLDIIVAAKLVRDVNTPHVMIVVIEAGRYGYLFLVVSVECRLGVPSFCTFRSQPPTKVLDSLIKVMDDSHQCDDCVVDPGLDAQILAARRVSNNCSLSRMILILLLLLLGNLEFRKEEGRAWATCTAAPDLVRPQPRQQWDCSVVVVKVHYSVLQVEKLTNEMVYQGSCWC
jgi:hypothetical protein